MKAVVKYEKGENKIRYMDFEKPVPKRGEVLIKVAFAGICGTDLKIQQEQYINYPPVVLGHEYSGTVEAVGEGVSDFKPGDRVISETAQIVCGKCEYCLSGNFLMCADRRSIGYGTNGAMGDYIAVREQIVHKVPDGVTLEEAALCEPSAVSFHAVFDYTNIGPVDTAVVFGPGTIGQLVSQLAASTGAKVVLCGTEADEKRLEIARELGIETLTVGVDDIEARLKGLTDGKGADYAFDCSGVAPAVSSCLHCLKKKGTLVQVGLTKETVSIDYGLVAMNELTIKGAFGHINSSWKGVLKMMQKGKLNVKPLITGQFSFENWEAGFKAARELECVKVLLHP